jgi:putative ABC transport system permease protein
MFRNYFKTSFRNLWKSKTFSFLNIFGLAIGIACAGLIYLWVEDEMSFDNTNLKKDRLYQLNVNFNYNGSIFTMGSTPRPMAAALIKEVPGVINTARVSDGPERLLFSFTDKSLYAYGRYADASLFGMFTFHFIQGNPLNPFPQLYSLVVTEKTVKKFFGGETDVIGKRIKINNQQEYIISGVVKDMPENSTLQFEWLAPYQVTLAENRLRFGENTDEFDYGSYGPFTYVELDSKANPVKINWQIKNFIQGKKANEKSEAFIFPMASWRLYSEFENGKPTGSGRIRQVRMLSAIAWIILFIACINFMNLSTASSQKRAREVGVRKVLGAGKSGLIARFIGEALFLSMLAAITAIVIVICTLPFFNTLVQKNLSIDPGNPIHICALLFIAIICGLVAGSYPSVYLSSFNPVFVLKGLKLKTGGAALVRKGLVVFQFAVSVVFIICTIIVFKQIEHVKDRNLGFNKNNLIEIDMQHDVSGIFSIVKQHLLATGVVENAAMIDNTIIYGGNTDNGFIWEGKSDNNETGIAFRSVSPEFISTSGMQVIEGRDFNADMVAEKSSVIINQTMAKMMGNTSAVGKIIRSPRGNKPGVYDNLTVTGVINDYVYGNMFGKSGPVLFFCKPPENAQLLYIRTKPQSRPDDVLAKIEAVMKKDNSAYPFEFRFVDDQFNQMFFNEVLISKIAAVFATLAIVISCLGLFGLAAYTAERRTKEIGIRKVLGASVSGLFRLLSKDFVQLVAISCLVAFPVGWWIMHSWLQTYEYRIAISWWIFFVAGLAALLIALLTIGVHAIKAAIANPVDSLRNE